MQSVFVKQKLYSSVMLGGFEWISLMLGSPASIFLPRSLNNQLLHGMSSDKGVCVCMCCVCACVYVCSCGGGLLNVCLQPKAETTGIIEDGPI